MSLSTTKFNILFSLLIGFFLIGCGSSSDSTPSSSKEITGFSFSDGVIKTSVIDGTEINITIDYYYSINTDPLPDLTPNITHTGVSYSPEGEDVSVFGLPITYTVTAQDGTTKEYNVTVKRAIVINDVADLQKALNDISNDNDLRQIDLILNIDEFNLLTPFAIPAYWSTKGVVFENNASKDITIKNLAIHDRAGIDLSETGISISNTPGIYIVDFYDTDLTLVGTEAISTNNGYSLADKFGISDWYHGNSVTVINSLSAIDTDQTINLYALSSVVEISNQTILAAINTNADTLNGAYILIKDIELKEYEPGFGTDGTGWKPIGIDYDNSFTGIFSGGGHNIGGLWINATTDNVGLFGYIRDAQIKDLGVEISGNVSGAWHVGGIAGEVYRSNITDSYTTGNVSGRRDYVGGIAGSVYYDSSITNSYAMGNVSGRDYVGGIVGYVDYQSSITNNSVSGSVSGTDSVGGIAGNVRDGSTITNSYTSGSVSGRTDSVGGIAGSVYYDSSITNSYAMGNVSGARCIGGITGYVDYQSSITNSYASGNVNGTDYVGGIAGSISYGSSITNSYATGNVRGDYYVGGIAGNVWDGNITNSYAAGNVSGADFVGGIAGWVSYSTITNNAAINPSVTGSSDVNRIVGHIDNTYVSTVEINFALESMIDGAKTLADGGFGGVINDNSGDDKSDTDLKKQETYEDLLIWDFTNIWDINEGNSYPYLR